MVNFETYDLNAVFHALADPTRRQIVARLCGQTLSISELARPFKMSLVAISKHVSVLENARLVTRQKNGRTTFCQVNEEAMLSAEQWLAHYTRFWNARLDALDEFIENTQGEKNAK